MELHQVGYLPEALGVYSYLNSLGLKTQGKMVLTKWGTTGEAVHTASKTSGQKLLHQWSQGLASYTIYWAATTGPMEKVSIYKCLSHVEGQKCYLQRARFFLKRSEIPILRTSCALNFTALWSSSVTDLYDLIQNEMTFWDTCFFFLVVETSWNKLAGTAHACQDTF